MNYFQKFNVIKLDFFRLYNQLLLKVEMQLGQAMSMGNDFTSMSGQKKIEPIDLTFQDKVLKRQNKRSTFTRKYFPWVRIDEMKKDLAKNKYNNKIVWDQLRLFCKNIQLENNHRFFDYNVQQENNIIIQKVQNIDMPQNGIINPYQIFQSTPKQITDLILAVQSGLNAGRKPKLSEEGTSGTYFLENHEKKKIAIFKPHDEEPFAPSNPRGYIGNLGGNGIRKGILSGEAATREVAAFLLDVNKFHKVPPTTYVEFYHPSFNYNELINSVPIKSGTQTDLKALKTKHGSLQEFVQSHDVAGNLGSHQFDIEQVHRIGILDLRILNCDRNQANILIKKVNVTQTKTNKQYKKILMIPIDHGLCFPDNFQIYEYQMVWMSYPQSKRPFSQKSLEFIQNIKPDEDCKLLRQKLGFREICLRNFKIAQIFLKKMAAQGFTLYEIGSKVYRMDDDDDYDEEQNQGDQDDKSQKKKSQQNENKSELEKLVKRTEQIYNLVKQNGIKSTVQFQIGLIKLRRQQQSLTFLQQKRLQIETNKIHEEAEEKQEDIQHPKIEKKSSVQGGVNHNHLKHKISQEKKLLESSIQKMEHIQSIKKSLPKVRNVSLPHLKKVNSKEFKPKKKKHIINSKNKNNNGWKKDETWEEIFFHYFEDLLDEYIKKLKNKKKQQQKPPQRGRLMSENIDL